MTCRILVLGADSVSMLSMLASSKHLKVLQVGAAGSHCRGCSLRISSVFSRNDFCRRIEQRKSQVCRILDVSW